MAINVPVVAHLRVLSLIADLRDELPNCSKYIPKEQVLVGNTIRSFPVSSLQSIGLKPSLPPNSNLAQLEILLQHSKVLGWHWTNRFRLQILLSSCVLVNVFLNPQNGIDVVKVTLDQTLTPTVRKRFPVCCEVSDSLVVVGFSNTELTSYRVNGPKDGTAICHYKKRSKLHNNCDMQMAFSDDKTRMVLCFAPVRTYAGRQWFPKKAEDSCWTLHVYACDVRDGVPLKRLHRSQGRARSRVLQLCFLPKIPGCFIVMDYVDGPEPNISVLYYGTNGRSLQLFSCVSVDTLGTLLSSAIHAEKELIGIGLEDCSVAIFDIRQNTLRRKICDVRPEHIKWNPDGLFLAIINSEASVQIMDLSLQFLPQLFLNDVERPANRLRLRTSFNSVSPLAKCEWISLIAEGQTDSPTGYFSSGILLQFERGPLSILSFARNPDNVSQIQVLVNYRIAREEFIQVVRLLKQTNHEANSREAITGIRNLLGYIVQVIQEPDESVGDLICDALSTLQEAASTAQDESAEETYYSVGRLVFNFFLRVGQLSSALTAAKTLNDERLYKQVWRAACRRGETEMITAAEKEMTEYKTSEKELFELLETDRNDHDEPDYMTIYPTITPTAPPLSPSPLPPRLIQPPPGGRSASRLSSVSTTSERYIPTFMWTDMGTV
ncbi:WD repeat-containing and planar cell polarity effector protein fritz homolog [Paramacrobiotus metropolitanus]|uniref:WD repeat-containing and planar cell polarity effector protein fritz homolog n=1 Tax=Paramacrobiotus metropolitanus TaxID=2943436 RepID=UPI00244625D6|nr:WD repeat-containing and planar cell polarity effector protein fritz homolog [Paramacrobiotus metropolitanus]XP_055328030.1 WD repeat-containing and planar cell polarity effector protein fritz homolog [Paramacrobiotus metropolitanus]XP_055328031.1 WD repeat-containing and planar cell polarity effector protein fritz homolog [Paramacrobiotus metropolitanus]